MQASTNNKRMKRCAKINIDHLLKGACFERLALGPQPGDPNAPDILGDAFVRTVGECLEDLTGCL